jgi:hypothetical protein
MAARLWSGHPAEVAHTLEIKLSDITQAVMSDKLLQPFEQQPIFIERRLAQLARLSIPEEAGGLLYRDRLFFLFLFDGSACFPLANCVLRLLPIASV